MIPVRAAAVKNTRTAAWQRMRARLKMGVRLEPGVRPAPGQSPAPIPSRPPKKKIMWIDWLRKRVPLALKTSKTLKTMFIPITLIVMLRKSFMMAGNSSTATQTPPPDALKELLN